MKKIAPILLLLASCSRTPPPPEPLRPVETVILSTQTSPAGIGLPGEVQARHEAPLSFRVSGKIVACDVSIGEAVKRGEALAKIEPDDYRLEVRAAQADESAAQSALDLARTDLSRFRELHEKGFVSQAALDQKIHAENSARARLDAAKADRSEKSRHLSYTTLVADRDGIITRYDCNPGEVVPAGQPVMALATSNQKEVAIDIPEADLERFRKTGIFEVSLHALPGRKWRGKIREISGTADPSTRTYYARISLENASPDIALGMSAEARLIEPDRNSTQLPLSAVLGREGKPFVWTVDAAGTVKKAPVSVSGIDGNRVEISGGLHPGDRIVTAGANLLHEGEKVKP
ncbi:MAG: efflux RND transporter periplasmic adaptor subunit [Burkholderiales bacterium]|nr:efflux RND transporter periplasmic adaptor subunit [Burkholderiales bacterium]